MKGAHRKVKEVREKVRDFLKKYDMDYDRIDIVKEVEVFIEDMQKGLDGKPGNLDMLPTYIPMSEEIPSNEPVVVMDAGGTNFRVAVVHLMRIKAGHQRFCKVFHARHEK